MAKPKFVTSANDDMPEPLTGQVLLMCDNEEKKTESGLVIPGQSRTSEYFWRAKVVAIAHGEEKSYRFKVGDIVAFERPGLDFTIGEIQYLLLPGERIRARIPQKVADKAFGV